ncbi:hypothetical protein [Stenotrophomonas acidaminiphila]|uniref:hypothetical protein n=1 Tax=Stenotrophomonas acidaminiphila TaxID=128780 RepID=UPI003D053D08
MDLKSHGVGFISYEWNGMPAGVIDAGKGGQALVGLDDAIRYFNRRQIGSGQLPEYELPVLTGNGSWVAVVLGTLAAPAAIFGMAYTKKAAEKMAERDFSELGFRDIARKSADALVKLIRVLKASKGKISWNTANIRWSQDARTAFLKIESQNEIEIPAEYIKWYAAVPPSVIRRITTPVNESRTLSVGARQDDGSFDTVNVEATDLPGLQGEDNPSDADFLFPELVHGHDVELEGIVTRGNQSTNSIGFQYRGHILNCNPDNGSVKRFKAAMFLQCQIKATVNRHVSSLSNLDYRPTLLIHEVRPLEDDTGGQQGLF